MNRNTHYTYGEKLFAEFCRLFPEHNFGLIDVFVASLGDDRAKISYRIKSGSRLLDTRWPRLTDSEWKATYSGIRTDQEMICYLYEQMMVELGYWRINDPDAGDYFPIDPDKFFLFVDNKTNQPIEEHRLFQLFKFPEDV